MHKLSLVCFFLGFPEISSNNLLQLVYTGAGTGSGTGTGADVSFDLRFFFGEDSDNADDDCGSFLFLGPNVIFTSESLHPKPDHLFVRRADGLGSDLSGENQSLFPLPPF